MKMFALSLLGFAALVSAEEGNAMVVRRRRLAETCTFAPLRAGPHIPNCLAEPDWGLNNNNREPINLAINHHDYRCCVNKIAGWGEPAKLINQQSCTGAAACNGIKAFDATCRTNINQTSYYIPGYSFADSSCNGFADDCRAGLSCDTAAGFSGTADLACHGDFVTSGEFMLRGCGRGDLQTLGTDLTSNVLVVVPNAHPLDVGTSKNSFAECEAIATSVLVGAFAAGNGGCDSLNNCYPSNKCQVFATSWGAKLTPSESEDTYVNLLYYKSEVSSDQSAPCYTFGAGSGKIPTAGDAFTNTCAQAPTDNYGGFTQYGDRFKCWHNFGGGINSKKNTDVAGFDLTLEVFASTVNAGIGQTLLAYEIAQGNAFASSNAVWNEKNGKYTGYGVCTGTSAGVGGCTAELAAAMCEAYNRQTPANAFVCSGFALADADQGIGSPKKKKYKSSTVPRMLVAFFSTVADTSKWEATYDHNGGIFRYYEPTNCDLTSTKDCSRCAKCKATFFLTSDGQCTQTCPKYQYADSGTGTCAYCAPHCIDCSSASVCTACRASHTLSADKSSCEEIGCTLPSSFKSSTDNKAVVGAAVEGAPACIVSQNLVPKASCGVGCVDGEFSTDSQKLHVYSCPSPGATAATPTLTCAACSNTANCKTCPDNTCTACLEGLFLDGTTCKARACPTASETAGSCITCAAGFAGNVTWSFGTENWDTSPCVACVDSNCLNCHLDAAVCTNCASGYVDNLAGSCIALETCDYGEKGTVTYNKNLNVFDKSGCAPATGPCEDPSQTSPGCYDCKDGHAGSVDWDYAKQEWITTQCHIVACPVTSESPPNCNSCPEFTQGTPVWNDLFNSWEGCIAADFGFSGPLAMFSVSADQHVIDTNSAEMLHVANGQFDAIMNEWICDEGYAGVGCQQRLCTETSSFLSGTDTFTPSLSSATTWMTEIGNSDSATFSNQHSYRQCSGRGTCDYETGLCQCFPGFTGVACQRTSCPNGCSGHGVCVNDGVANYRAAGNNNLPSGDLDVNTWGNLWAQSKFQSCRCDGGWSGNDCSLRQCPRGDDPETACDEDQGNDVQILQCEGLLGASEAYFKLRFTNQLGHRYNSRAIVIPKPTTALATGNFETVGADFSNTAAHSIQTALESLPNFAIPKVEVTPSNVLTIPLHPAPSSKTFAADVPEYAFTATNVLNNKNEITGVTIAYDFVATYKATFEIKFPHPRNSGKLPLLEVEGDTKCASGVQPKYDNAATPALACTITRKADAPNVAFRENEECSNRGLCNRKTAECSCFDGYTGISCDTIAQTY